MNKMLVTTDFSANSKKGMRFALRWAAQAKAEIVYLHCFQALIPTTLHVSKMEEAIWKQTKGWQQKLEKFVRRLHAQTGLNDADLPHYQCVVIEGVSPTEAIMDYAEAHRFDFICMSARGAGLVKKIIGTNTSVVLTQSRVPVLAVPQNYRSQPVRKLLYASDLENFDIEMEKALKVASSVGAELGLLHFYAPSVMAVAPGELLKNWKKRFPALAEAVLAQLDSSQGFVGQLEKELRKLKPDVVLFFTQPNQTWFDKIFRVSRTEMFSFSTKFPMLVIRKGA
jgi:nucleotide-binding universal stress UspA family protein